MSKIKEVKVSPACIACGTCAVVCPEVFHVDSISRVKEDVDLDEYKGCIKEAVDVCPVKAIEIVYSEGEDKDV